MWFLTLRAKCMEEKKNIHSIKIFKLLTAWVLSKFIAAQFFPQIQLQDYTKSSSRETEVKFQLSKDTLEAMLRSMTYISEQFSNNVSTPYTFLFWLPWVGRLPEPPLFLWYDQVSYITSSKRFLSHLYRADFASSAFEAIYLDLCPLSFHYLTCS